MAGIKSFYYKNKWEKPKTEICKTGYNSTEQLSNGIIPPTLTRRLQGELYGIIMCRYIFRIKKSEIFNCAEERYHLPVIDFLMTTKFFCWASLYTLYTVHTP